MKKLAILLIVLCSFSCQSNTEKATDKFYVKRGTNVAHWLSQSNRRGTEREQFFVESDVEKIAGMGFDHIRLPIDEVQMWDENGNRHEDAFQLMINCINWCKEYNLKVIVDVHIIRSHYFLAEEKPLWTVPAEQEKFYNLWRDLSKALNQFPNSHVAYELMNEAVADDPEQWNDLIANTVKALRELEPERTIVIGSNRWQSVDTFDELKVSENDPNILLSFHYYEPMMLTHLLASWTNYRNYPGPVHYPGILVTDQEFKNLPDSLKTVAEGSHGRVFNKEIILEMWQKPINKAKELGLPLYCGEFGVYNKAPEEDRLRWYKDIIQLFEENGIGYANWNYKSSAFGVVDEDGKRFENLIEVIVPNTDSSE
jgi:endoglucanase